MTDGRVVDIPLELNGKINHSKDICHSDPTLYREIVGSLIYLSITQPDIAYEAQIVSQFVLALCTTHWGVVIHILHYVHETLFWSLLFSFYSELVLCAYSNVDWAGDVVDQKSTTSY